MKTIRDHILVEYQPPEDWQSRDGIILPSETEMRRHLSGGKGAGGMDFKVDTPPPDIHRYGRLLEGFGKLLGIPERSFIYFNRHDADHFEHDGKKYYRINKVNALAYYIL